MSQDYKTTLNLPATEFPMRGDLPKREPGILARWEEQGLYQQLRDNARHFRERIIEAGFAPLPGETPIVPIIVGETSAAIQMSDLLLEQGVFVTGFGFPVVPQGKARVRCQISSAHTRDDLDEAVAAFTRVGRKLGIV